MGVGERIHQDSIRFAGTADVPQLRRLYQQLADAEYALETPHSGLLRPLEDRVRELWARLHALGSEDAFWFVAPGPGELIGSVGVVAEANTAAIRLYMAHGMYSTGRTLVCDLK
jgi:hypothetical protein